MRLNAINFSISNVDARRGFVVSCTQLNTMGVIEIRKQSPREKITNEIEEQK